MTVNGQATLVAGPKARALGNEGKDEQTLEVHTERETIDAGARPVVDRRQGGCMCGAIRFSVAGDPLRTGLCHCADCRKFSGSAFSFFAVWPKSTFVCDGEFGTFKGRSFCPTCGSRAFSLSDDEAEIMVGSLDEAPSSLLPDYELWIHRREPWLLQSPWAEQHVGDRLRADNFKAEG